MTKGIRIDLAKVDEVESIIREGKYETLTCKNCGETVKPYLCNPAYSKGFKNLRFHCPKCGNIKLEKVNGSTAFIFLMRK